MGEPLVKHTADESTAELAHGSLWRFKHPVGPRELVDHNTHTVHEDAKHSTMQLDTQDNKTRF